MAQTNIGPRIGVDGEDEYRKAINNIIQQAKTLDAEMKAVASSFASNASAEDKAAAKSEVLSQRIEAQKERVRLLSEMLDKSREATGDNSSQTLKWREALANAQTTLNQLENEAAGTADAVEDLGNEMDETGGKSSRFRDLLKANLTSEAIIRGLGKLVDGLKAAGEAMVSFSKDVVMDFSELEQNLGGSEAVFRDFAETVQRSAEQAYRTMGTSESDYLATANKMGALFQGSGLTVERSMELSTAAMSRAADMASVMGIDTQSALEAVSGAAKGNYTMMDNLGVAMNATTLEAYALSKGIKTTWAQMDNAEKAEVAMAYFFERTEQYAGNFEREARETISGSIGMLQASVQSWVAGLGNSEADIKVLTANVVDSFETVVKNVRPVVENLIHTLPEAARTALPAVLGLLPDLLAVATELFSDTVSMVLSLLPDLIPVAADAVLTFADALLEPDNILLLIDASFELIFALANGLIDALPALIEKAPMIIVSLIDAILRQIPRMLSTGVNLLGGLIEGIISGTGGLWQAWYQIQYNLEELADSLVTNAKHWGRDLIVNFANGIAERASAVWDNVKEVASGVWDYLHFSEPEKGPLSDFSTYAPDMMETFASGILSNKAMLQRAVSSAFDLEPYIQGGMGAGPSYNYGGVSVVIYTTEGQSAAEIYDEFEYRLQESVVSARAGVA